RERRRRRAGTSSRGRCRWAARRSSARRAQRAPVPRSIRMRRSAANAGRALVRAPGRAGCAVAALRRLVARLLAGFVVVLVRLLALVGWLDGLGEMLAL